MKFPQNLNFQQQQQKHCNKFCVFVFDCIENIPIIGRIVKTTTTVLAIGLNRPNLSKSYFSFVGMLAVSMHKLLHKSDKFNL